MFIVIPFVLAEEIFYLIKKPGVIWRVTFDYGVKVIIGDFFDLRMIVGDDHIINRCLNDKIFELNGEFHR